MYKLEIVDNDWSFLCDNLINNYKFNLTTIRYGGKVFCRSLQIFKKNSVCSMFDVNLRELSSQQLIDFFELLQIRLVFVNNGLISKNELNEQGEEGL